MSIVLADLGGTHLRLAHEGKGAAIVKYKIADYPDIATVLTTFAPDISALYLAAAIHPRGGIIEDKRFGDLSHWTIDLAALKQQLSLKRLTVLNDLEAAAYGLATLEGDDVHTLLAAKDNKPHFDYPPKLLVGIGTGIGHAYLFEKPGHPSFVQRSHGGHIPALAVTAEQKDIVHKLTQSKSHNRDLIVEDIVSGHGFSNLKTVANEKDATRLFWEFLGLYCNALVSLAGSYGGVYLTGGVMDEFFAAKAIDRAAFETYFLRPMVPVVIESLSSTPVHYVREPNLPIVGLSTLAGHLA